MRTRITAAALAVAVLTLPCPSADATPRTPGDDPLTWSVAPSGPQGPNGRPALDYKLDPGATVTDHVAVTNHSRRPLILRLYASDAFTTTGGGFDLLAGNAKPTDAGSWIALKQTTIVLPSVSRLVVPLTLTVPANATPGDHAAGVVASMTGTGEAAEGGRVSVDHRVGTRVYLRVTGPLRPALTTTDVRLDGHTPWNPFRLPHITATFTVRNNGNVRLPAQGSVEARGPFGLGRAAVTTPPIPEILPGGSIPIKARINAVPPLFHERVTIAITSSTTDANNLWLVPWPQLALVAVLITGVLLVRRRIRTIIAAAEQRGRDHVDATRKEVS